MTTLNAEGLRPLRAEEMEVRGGCELFCALAHLAGYAYESAVDWVRAQNKTPPSMYARGKIG